MQNDIFQHVFLVGAKSLGAYGGYETFINKLTEYHQTNRLIKYHVACKANGEGHMDPYAIPNVDIISDKEFVYQNAHCFRIKVPQFLGPAQAIYYDVMSLVNCCRYIKKLKIINPIIYIMACRIGPFAKYFYHRIQKLGGRLYINPDGHEWKRSKWSLPVRKYWKWSEKNMVMNCDLVICDSVSIERYIHKEYDNQQDPKKNPMTTYISYGAETRCSELSDDDECLLEFYQKNEISTKEYYLIVGRFVPENNYETMIREFVASHTNKSLVIIANKNEELLKELIEKLHFESDKRIKFVGTIYNQELLMKIRENAYAYMHGHEVGGTNPSLLEALASTKLNLLLDIGFNKEVALDSAKYWSKEQGNLSELIDSCEKLDDSALFSYGNKAKQRIQEAYSWEFICNEYLKVFTQR